MKTMRTLEVITATALWMLSACDQAAPDDAAVSVGTAHLTVSDDAHAAASAKVAAKDAATGKLVQETTIALDQQSSLDLSLRPGSYLLDIQAFADKAASALLCSRSAKIEVGAQATAKVDVKITADGHGAV